MNWVDWVILATAAFSVLAGFMDGLVRTVLSLVSVIVGFIVAARHSDGAARLLTQWMRPELATPLGFILTFLAVLVLFALLTVLLRKSLEKLSLSGFDRLMGGAFGLARAAAVLGLLALMVENFGGLQVTRASKTFPYALTSGKVLLELIPDKAKERLNWKIFEPRQRKPAPDPKRKSSDDDGNMI